MIRTSPRRLSSDRGVAIILVVFVVALATILVVNLTYSTQLGSRRQAHASKSIEAEYLLKSALNLARVLVRREPGVPDKILDARWMAFKNGTPIDPALLGLDNTNVRIELEIRPEDSKFPLREIMPSGLNTPDIKWRDAAVQLFRLLKFDEDKEQDQTGLFKGKVFYAEEMVANLIDYMDPDETSYKGDNFAEGIEDALKQLNPDQVTSMGIFPNRRLERMGELQQIPGFSPARLRKLLPLCTAQGSGRININTAPELVLRSLPGIGEAEAKQLIAFRSSDQGPFDSLNKQTALSSILNDEVLNKINPMIGIQSQYFQVIAKVDYGYTNYFIRASLSNTNNPEEFPEIRSLELF